MPCIKIAFRPLLLAVTATLGFGYLAFGGIDADAILQTISRVSVVTMASAVSLFLIAVTLRITRWWFLMRSFQPTLRFATCVKPFLLSIAANDFMPVRIGDLVKMFANREGISVPPSTRLGTIIIERLFDTLSILLIFFIGALQLDVPAGVLRAAYLVLIVSIIALVLILFFSQIAEKWTFSLLNIRLLRNRRFLRKAKDWNSQFFQTFAQLRNKGLVGLFTLSFVIWGIEGSMALILAWGIDPSANPLGPYLSLSCGALSNFLPSAPGMLGTLDYFLTLGVLGYGMVKSSAVAFALLVHAVFLGFSVTVAAVLLPRKNTWIMLRSFTKSNSSDDDMNPNNEFLNERTDA